MVAPAQEGGDDVVDIIRLGDGLRGPGGGAAAPARGDRNVGRLRRPRRPGAAGRAGLRAVALVAGAQARLRPRGRRGLVLAAAAPLLLLIALAIKLSSRGPILFRQTRVGRHGREFQMLKFRTMVRDADERKQELLELNEAAPMFKIADDPRVTRVGRFLRRSVARRAAPARQRPARRHEPGRPTAARHRGGPPLLRLAAAPLPRGAGGHRALADPRLEPRADGRHAHDRLPLLRQLVALARRQDPGEDDPVRAEPARPRVLSAATERPSARARPAQAGRARRAGPGARRAGSVASTSAWIRVAISSAWRTLAAPAFVTATIRARRSSPRGGARPGPAASSSSSVTTIVVLSSPTMRASSVCVYSPSHRGREHVVGARGDAESLERGGQLRLERVARLGQQPTEVRRERLPPDLPMRAMLLQRARRIAGVVHGDRRARVAVPVARRPSRPWRAHTPRIR